MESAGSVRRDGSGDSVKEEPNKPISRTERKTRSLLIIITESHGTRQWTAGCAMHGRQDPRMARKAFPESGGQDDL